MADKRSAKLPMLSKNLTQLPGFPPPVVLVVPVDKVDEPPPRHEGVLMGEVTGWRAWMVSPGIELYSLVTPTRWRPGVPMEGDVDSNSGMPFKIPTGVYALTDRGSALWQLARWMLDHYQRQPTETRYHPWKPIGFVFGSVNLYGEVVFHAHGYRAQFAKITSLDSIHSLLARDDDVPGLPVLDRLRHTYLGQKTTDGMAVENR